MDELKTMRTFVKVADEGSFSGAARALNLSNSVVTRGVAELEGALKCRLLNRTTRAVSLTEVGAQYLERVRGILEEIDDANTQAAEATGKVRGLLRVAAPQDLLIASLARLVPRFVERHPEVQVHFMLSSPQAVAPEEGADVTILVQGPEPLDGQFVVRPLAHAQAVLCASPEYLRMHARPLLRTPQDLLQHVVHIPEAAARRGWLFHGQDEGGAARTMQLEPPRGATISSENAAVLMAVARGHAGIAAALSLNVADDLRNGTLVRVLPQWSVASFRVLAAMRSRTHLPLRTRVFVDFLVEQYGGEATDPWLAGRLR